MHKISHFVIGRQRYKVTADRSRLSRDVLILQIRPKILSAN